MADRPSVPIILLKTRSQPHDTYEEQLSSFTITTQTIPSIIFKPIFVPVLEHQHNEEALGSLASLLKSGKFKDRYGGMIFTSQRAVEGWASTVATIEQETSDENDQSEGQRSVETTSLSSHTAIDTRSNQPFATDIQTSVPFPLYSVGPATSRALTTLITSSTTMTLHPSPFASLNPVVLGTHTGNGASLASYIKSHYNTLHIQRYFDFYEAPRLPFIPLLGMGSENYSRKRLERDDPRLRKQPLLFQVGEQRRDIIPKTLMLDPKLEKRERIEVEEVEVYSTVVKSDFKYEFEGLMHRLSSPSADADRHDEDTKPHALSRLAIIIIFSPQGTAQMLRSLDLITDSDTPTQNARHLGQPSQTQPPSLESTSNSNTQKQPRYILITIGPTTRDYVRDTFGIEPDAMAPTPSPEGVMTVIKDTIGHMTSESI